jgi:hypothetical protein
MSENKVYIVSTMTGDVSYNIYDFIGKDAMPVVRESIVIRGGASLPSMRSGFGNIAQTDDGIPMWTADGIVTPVSLERYALLKENKIFQKHLEGNMVKVLNKDITGNHKEVSRIAKDMDHDGFRQASSATIKSKVKVTMAKSGGEDFRL